MEQQASYNDGAARAQVTVRAATALTGMRRALLQGRAAEAVDALGFTADTLQSAARVLLFFHYPACVAATVAVASAGVPGLPEQAGTDFDLAPAAFLDLPEALVDAWVNAVYSLNPHWMPRPAQPSESEKKDGAASSSAFVSG